MPISIPFLATSDNYTPTLTLGPDDQIREIRWNVSAPNSAFAQIAVDTGGGQRQQGKAQFSGQDFICQPGPDGFSGDTGCKGIRFKSFIAGTPTTVVATAYFYNDPAPVGLVPSNTQFAGGSQTPSPATLQFQRNNGLVSSEPILNVLDSNAIFWSLVDDPSHTRVNLTPFLQPSTAQVFSASAQSIPSGALTQVTGGGGGTNGPAFTISNGPPAKITLAANAQGILFLNWQEFWAADITPIRAVRISSALFFGNQVVSPATTTIQGQSSYTVIMPVVNGASATDLTPNIFQNSGGNVNLNDFNFEAGFIPNN